MAILSNKDGSPFHVLSVAQFDPDLCERLFRQADRFKEGFADNEWWWRYELHDVFSKRVLVGWFEQQSTRTDLCFALAAKHLGMETEMRSDIRQISSAAKGESDTHTMRIIAGYHPSVVVIRHREEGGVARMSAHSTVPVINAGDGKGEHPTQALLDLYTVLREKGRGNDLSHLTIVIGGDLEGRAARSFALLLANYRPRIIFVSPKELQMGDDVLKTLENKRVLYTSTTDPNVALPHANVVYWTRVQNDQRTQEERARLAHIDLRHYQIRPDHLLNMRPDVRIMHPLPINREEGAISEIDPAIDDLPQAIYFTQAENGLYVRMAILSELLK